MSCFCSESCFPRSFGGFLSEASSLKVTVKGRWNMYYFYTKRWRHVNLYKDTCVYLKSVKNVTCVVSEITDQLDI